MQHTDTTDCVSFIAGCNQPGYLPDNEPAGFDSFDAAKRYIIECILMHEADAWYDEKLAEELASLAQDINLESDEFSTARIDSYVYWVHQVEEM